MKHFFKVSFLVLLFFTVFAAADNLGSGGTFITPDNDKLQYSGRINFVNPHKAVLSWSGSSVKICFTGRNLKVILEDNGKNSFEIIVDTNDVLPQTVRCSDGKNVYTVAENLAGGQHEVLLYKRTEFSVGQTGFLGFILDVDAEIVPAPEQNRKMEFYGDSITCGMGNEDYTRQNNSDMSLENHYLTYGAMACRDLNAQGFFICQSGIGFMKSWFEGIMPDIYARCNPADANSKWDFTKYQPDVVVVNLGTNDSWLIGKMTPVPTEMQIVSNYAEFIRKLRGHYRTAFIICSLGNMNSTAEGAVFPDYITKAVEMLKAEGVQKIDTVFFPYKNTDAHPTVPEQRAMANDLVKKIKQCTNWQ